MGWDQIDVGVELPFDPELTIPELKPYSVSAVTPPALDDVERVAFDQTVERFADQVTDSMTVAVGVGSRGLVARVELVRGTIAGLRELGARPFVVPAMGSHGGATAEGQAEVLAVLGITEESVGAEIRATMDTVVVAHTPSGRPIHLDANAASADRFLPVNRIKPHTCFQGTIQSGCAKMTAVGFGKRAGAAMVHSCGPTEMAERIVSAVAALRETGRLLGGVASLESSAGEVVHVEALAAADIGQGREIELTQRSHALIGTLPFDDIDVLIIEEGGKDISGITMDPHVTGRFWVPGLADPTTPRIGVIVLLDLTEVTEGNAIGIGAADIIPASLARKIDFRTTYLNCFTAGPSGLRRSRLPMVLPDEESCIKAALTMCGKDLDEPKRVVRIRSTLNIFECWISPAVLND